MWQGRQEHGWFGHSTKPRSGPSPSSIGQGSVPSLDNLDQRIRSLGRAVVTGLPASKRQHPAATFDGPTLERLTNAMRACTEVATAAQDALDDLETFLPGFTA